MITAQPIVFYDIPCADVEDKTWSPNTWKTRLVLNYKGIPYRTVWVEYPDIERTCKELGAAPAGLPGWPQYTLPVIYDPLTKTAVSESGRIVRYLDKTYPDTPRLVPEGTDAFHAAFDAIFVSTVMLPMLPVMLPAANRKLNPVSEQHYRRTREERFGKLEDWSPPGPVREKHWEEVRQGWGEVAGWMSADGQEKQYFMGDRMSYADVTLASFLMWVRRVHGSESAEWTDLQTWDGGKWARFIDLFEPYAVAKG